MGGAIGTNRPVKRRAHNMADMRRHASLDGFPGEGMDARDHDADTPRDFR
jgi:hypothetical protein